MRNFIVWLYRKIGIAVYVIEYEYHGRVKQRLTKVGYSNDPKERARSIQGNLPGRIRSQVSYWVWNAPNIEKKIHRRLAKKRTRPFGAGPGAGAEEFFSLRTTDKLALHFRLTVLSLALVGRFALIMFLPLAAFITLDAQSRERLFLFIENLLH